MQSRGGKKLEASLSGTIAQYGTLFECNIKRLIFPGVYNRGHRLCIETGVAGFSCTGQSVEYDPPK